MSLAMRLVAFALMCAGTGCSSSGGGSPAGKGGSARVDGGSGGTNTGGSRGSSGGAGAFGSGGGGHQGTADAETDSSPSQEGGNGTDGQASSTVVGTLMTGGIPVPNVPVIIDGVTFVSDAQGKFTAKGIPSTYDATVITQNGGVTHATVFAGLSTRAPFFEPDVTFQGYSATVNGQLSGGAGFPNAAGGRASVGCIVPGVLLGVFSLSGGEGPAYGPMTLGWSGGGPSLDTTCFALQWSVDTNGFPTGYTGWATKPLSISGGGTFGKSDGTTPITNLALGAISDRSLTGTVNVPAGLSITRRVLRVGGVLGIQPVTDPAPAAGYQYRVPTGLGSVNTTFHVFADGSSGETAHTLARVDDSMTTLDVTLLAPPVQVLPVDAATQVDYTTPFTFSAPPNSVYDVEFSNELGTVIIDVFTTAKTVHVPNLTAAGVPLAKGGNYTWVVIVNGPVQRVEDLVVPSGSSATIGRSDASSIVRTFVVSTQ